MGSAGVVLAVLVLAGCGGGDKSPAAAQTESTSSSSSSKSPTHLTVKVLRKGRGDALPLISRTPRVTMSILYTATRYKTGNLFEKRLNPRHPLKIEYGPALSEGWERGLAGMKVGDRRELVVPESMMVEGPAAVYRIDLLGFKKNGTKIYARELKHGLIMPKAEIANLPPLTIARQEGPPPKHIEIIDLRKGTGAKVTKQDTVYVRYFEVEYPEAQERSRTGRYGPERFRLDETVKGWTVGLPGMRVGGRRELILPPNLTFPRWKPSWGYAPYVRIYQIDLLGVKRPTER